MKNFTLLVASHFRKHSIWLLVIYCLTIVSQVVEMELKANSHLGGT